MIFDRGMSARMKQKLCKTVVKPSILYGMATVPNLQRQEADLQEGDLKMLQLCLEVTKLNKIRRTYILGTVHVHQFRNKAKGETRIVWPCTQEG